MFFFLQKKKLTSGSHGLATHPALKHCLAHLASRCPRRRSPSSSPVADVASCVSRQQRDHAVLAPCSDDCSSVAAARRLAGPAHRLAVAARRSSSPAPFTGPAHWLDGCSKNQLLKKLVPNLLHAVPAKSNARCSKIKTWFQQKNLLIVTFVSMDAAPSRIRSTGSSKKVCWM